VSTAGEAERVARLLRRGQVPDHYRLGDWETCRVGDDLRMYVRGMPGFVADGRGLILFGPVGTGKSTTAGLLCLEAARHGLQPQWTYAPDLKDMLRPGPGGDRIRTLERQRAADLLIWDDFAVGGSTSLADWEIGWLDQIVEYRYQRRRSMIVTTNLTGQALREDDRLVRMIDRWRERNMGLVVTGETMRDWWDPR
jgi:DNA replication protein DnaC